MVLQLSIPSNAFFSSYIYFPTFVDVIHLLFKELITAIFSSLKVKPEDAKKINSTYTKIMLILRIIHFFIPKPKPNPKGPFIKSLFTTYKPKKAFRREN
jgi:hypothetical protein